ncbi:MAG: hypothetical protein AMJ90_00740 [candidate division Zixibacteria bacterium SM23_73_2]|nr:MAG: hypothetical protein AMJ90_00740 [candidate division Zixibacteria bacterium SM23_73_2]
MKRGFVLFVVLAFIFPLSCEQRVNIEAERSKIRTVLDNYVASVENEDMELYAENVAHDPEMVNFGSFGYPIIGWEALKKVMEDQNASLSKTKIEINDLKIHVSDTGKLAWATCLWNLKTWMDENPVDMPVRCTWVLEKRENQWVIVHFHKSIRAG